MDHESPFVGIEPYVKECERIVRGYQQEEAQKIAAAIDERSEHEVDGVWVQRALIRAIWNV